MLLAEEPGAGFTNGFTTWLTQTCQSRAGYDGRPAILSTAMDCPTPRNSPVWRSIV